jgi:hypothetical protein
MTVTAIVALQLKMQIHTPLDGDLDSGSYLSVLIALRLALARRSVDVRLRVDERAVIRCHLARDLLGLISLEMDIHLHQEDLLFLGQERSLNYRFLPVIFKRVIPFCGQTGITHLHSSISLSETIILMC